MRILAVGALVSVAALSGCASIVGGTSQVLSIQTMQAGNDVSGASCKLENDKGVWFVKTPGTVTVHRAYGELNVKCEKDGLDPGLAAVQSSTKGMAFGNILFGGVIGAGVDMASGAAYDYPPLITVSMGLKTLIEAPKKTDGAPQATPTQEAPAGTANPQQTAQANVPASK
jgi:hypothetical protein